MKSTKRTIKKLVAKLDAEADRVGLGHSDAVPRSAIGFDISDTPNCIDFFDDFAYETISVAHAAELLGRLSALPEGHFNQFPDEVWCETVWDFLKWTAVEY